MTEVYFIRHAQPNRTKGEDRTFPLSEKGQQDCERVNEFLADKSISVVLSSPFKRAYDTVAGFADAAGLDVEVIEDLRERKISNEWLPDFNSYCERQWSDFSYKLPNGECLTEVQSRNIMVLRNILNRYKEQNIAVGTHGCALNTIINYYDDSYGIKEVMDMLHKMPWAVKLSFTGQECVSIEYIDLI